MASPRSNWDINLQIRVRFDDGENVRHNPVMTEQVHGDKAGLGPGWEVRQ